MNVKNYIVKFNKIRILPFCDLFCIINHFKLAEFMRYEYLVDIVNVRPYRMASTKDITE